MESLAKFEEANGIYNVSKFEDVQYSKELKELVVVMQKKMNSFTQEMYVAFSKQVKELTMSDVGLANESEYEVFMQLFPSDKLRDFSTIKSDAEPKEVSALDKLFGNITSEVKPSDKQVAKYLELCAERNVKPDMTIDKKSSAEVSMLIDQLIKFRQISRKQRAMIVKSLVNIDKSVPELDGLSVKEASELFEKILEFEKENGNAYKPTEGQMDTVWKMWGCMDIDWETYELLHKKPCKVHGKAVSSKGKPYMIYLTKDEVYAQFAEKFDKKTISEFIDKNKPIWLASLNGKITKGQMSRINTLINQLASTHNINARELAKDIFGNIVDIMPHTTSKGKNFAPVGSEEFDQVILGLYSKKQASDLIQQLEKEKTNKTLTRSTLVEINKDYNMERNQVDAREIKKLGSLEFVKANRTLATMHTLLGEEPNRDTMDLLNNWYYSSLNQNEMETLGFYVNALVDMLKDMTDVNVDELINESNAIQMLYNEVKPKEEVEA